MTASDGTMPAGELCGLRMPRAQVTCARRAGHVPPCASPARMASQRAHARSRERVVTPEEKARWNRAYKFTRLGITEEEFTARLAAQGHACAMCREPFGDEYPQADHDHSCCPGQPRARARSCGQCLRCLRCNTALGYIEQYGDLARAYLQGFAAARAK